MYNNRRYRSRTKSVKADINIVPFLDILLVLLVIFMSAAPFITRDIKVSLPSSSAGITSVNPKQSVVLEVFGTHYYTLIINGNSYAKLTADDVRSLVDNQLRKDKNTIFLLGGGINVPYNDIVGGIGLLHSAGVQSVGLMIKPIN